jgi:cobalt-zinc-cadmium efflux system protein
MASHAHIGHTHRRTGTPTRRLAWVLGLTVSYTAAEIVGGLLSNSLALLADAGHMMTDNLALTLALLAAWFASRPPDPARTYGYQRAEILAAMVNGVALVVICVFIFWEAGQRLQDPPEVAHGLMAVVATGGLLVNLVAARMLHGHQHGLNVRAAYLHVLGDLLGSIGALSAAGLIAAFGWMWADPVASFLIGGIIIVSSTRLVLESINVLMEGAPPHLDTGQIRRTLIDTAGVGDVHELHVWSLGGGTPLLTAHLVLDHTRETTEVLRESIRVLRESYGIDHATLQVEPPDFNIENNFASLKKPAPGS